MFDYPTILAQRCDMANRVVLCCVAVMLMGMPQRGHAASAWILWEYDLAGTWSIAGAADTNDKCEKALAHALGQKRGSYTVSDAVEVTIGTGKGSLKTGATRVVTYYCLPDTVDPRKK